MTTPTHMCTIVWFRRDLRLGDNPALAEAAQSGKVIPVFVWSPEEEGQFQPGRASRWWLKESLFHLDSSLRSVGSRLILRRSSDTLKALLQIARAAKATHLFYNHLYDPVSLVRDHRVRQGLTKAGIVVYSFSGDLLYEPWEIYNEQGQAFTRFEDFWEQCQAMPFEPDVPLLPPKRIRGTSRKIASCRVEDLELEDELDASSNALLAREWSPGWDNAEKALDSFLKGPLLEYAERRRRVDATTSLLSPHLHFGEISVRKVFYDVRVTTHLLCGDDPGSLLCRSVSQFLRQLGFREYSRYLIFNFPFTHDTSLLPNLRTFPWRWDQERFKAWRQGRTGYPLVDAGMRELWATGWLHNKLRVVVASFCVKFLQLPWRWGLRYFWDTLLDADLECDILGWQFISGSLPDGQPLDRMDHPCAQGQELDSDGEYVRRWLPELARVPAAWIHHPWDAPANVLAAAGVELGLTYPAPIVDVAAAERQQKQAVRTMWQNEAELHKQQAGGACFGIPAPHRLSLEVSLLAPAAAAGHGHQLPVVPLLPEAMHKVPPYFAASKTDALEMLQAGPPTFLGKPTAAAGSVASSPATGRKRSISISSSKRDDALLYMPTESQQQAAATLLNVPVGEVLLLPDIDQDDTPQRCWCF